MESILFNAMTKPAKICGVDSDFFFLVLSAAFLVWAFSHSPLYAMTILPIFFIGYLEGRKDDYFFQVLIRRLCCGFTPNRKKWGCESYEPY